MSHKVGQATPVLLLTCFSVASIRCWYQLKICIERQMFCLFKDDLNKLFFKWIINNRRKRLLFFLFFFSRAKNKVRISKCCFGFILKYQAPVHLQLITFPPNDSDTITVFLPSTSLTSLAFWWSDGVKNISSSNKITPFFESLVQTDAAAALKLRTSVRQIVLVPSVK